MWHLSKKNPEADHRCKGPEVRCSSQEANVAWKKGVMEGLRRGWGGAGREKMGPRGHRDQIMEALEPTVRNLTLTPAELGKHHRVQSKRASVFAS